MSHTTRKQLRDETGRYTPRFAVLKGTDRKDYSISFYTDASCKLNTHRIDRWSYPEKTVASIWSSL